MSSIKKIISGPDTTIGRVPSPDGIDYWLKDIVEQWGDFEIDSPHAIQTILVDVLELVPRLIELDKRRRHGEVSDIERGAWKDRVDKGGATIDRLLAEVNRERKRADALKNRLDAAGRALSSIARAPEEIGVARLKGIARDGIILDSVTPCAAPRDCACHHMQNGVRWDNPDCPVHSMREDI